jgi:hypothetical protein
VCRAAGLPASKDVGAINILIRSLKEETEKAIGASITSASSSVPFFLGIYDEDLYGSCEYAGIEYMQLLKSTDHRLLLTYGPSSALTAYGFALCPNIQRPQECWQGRGFEGENYYIIEYIQSSLLAYHVSTSVTGAYRLSTTI